MLVPDVSAHLSICEAVSVKATFIIQFTRSHELLAHDPDLKVWFLHNAKMRRGIDGAVSNLSNRVEQLVQRLACSGM